MKKLMIAPVMALCMLTSACVTASESGGNENNIHSLVTLKANQHNVPPSFAHGVVKTESGYNPKAKNGSSKGLGQIQCGTARGIGFVGSCDKLYDPVTNLDYSFKYLRMALDKTNNNQCLAATLYNRGLGAKPVNSSYCKKVMKNSKH